MRCAVPAGTCWHAGHAVPAGTCWVELGMLCMQLMLRLHTGEHPWACTCVTAAIRH